MSFLILDEAGEIAAITTARAPGSIERAIPGGYPEFYKWDAATASFIEATARMDAVHHAAIDAGFSAAMRTIISDLPGQPQRYAQKYAEAIEYKSTGTAGPLLSAEATASGMTIGALADEIIAAAERCESVGIALEAERMAAKRAVSAATGQSAKQSAATVDWAAVIDNAVNSAI